MEEHPHGSVPKWRMAGRWQLLQVGAGRRSGVGRRRRPWAAWGPLALCSSSASSGGLRLCGLGRQCTGKVFSLYTLYAEDRSREAPRPSFGPSRSRSASSCSPPAQPGCLTGPWLLLSISAPSHDGSSGVFIWAPGEPGANHQQTFTAGASKGYILGRRKVGTPGWTKGVANTQVNLNKSCVRQWWW